MFFVCVVRRIQKLVELRKTEKKFETKIEKKIIGCSFGEAINRWQKIPTIKIPKRVREKDALLSTFNEIVKSFALGNNLAVITLCRSTFELVLFKYYGGETKSKPGNDPKLSEMINFASENFEIDKPFCIEQCGQMNKIDFPCIDICTIN